MARGGCFGPQFRADRFTRWAGRRREIVGHRWSHAGTFVAVSTNGGPLCGCPYKKSPSIRAPDFGNSQVSHGHPLPANSIVNPSDDKGLPKHQAIQRKTKPGPAI